MAKKNKLEPRMYVGTYSNEALIKRIRKVDHFSTKGLTDKQIDLEINQGHFLNGMPNPITFFFAPTISKACQTAKEMELKNFTAVSDNYYEKGVDY